MDDEVIVRETGRKSFTLDYTFEGRRRRLFICQDRLYVSRTHDVVCACDEGGGYRAFCDRGYHHR
jgi:hypothetical protein